jgi:5-methylcytosine-specific restriction endonuclease McrA
MTMIYVQNILGQPLMPTEDCRKVRILLKEHKAKVVKRVPFTIRLTVRVKTYVQPVTLGVDAGSKTIGISATTTDRELFTAEVKPRNDVVKLLSDRRAMRRSRRNRTTRYRMARFNNRVKSKHKGWVAPSVQVKITEHIKAIQLVCQILPITTIRVETAEFDLQRLKAQQEGKPLPVGTDYQHGEQYNEYNVRQYILHRDGYCCRNCGTTPTEKNQIKLHVHHIESRKTGGNRPANLVTLCEKCHKAYHAGKIELNLDRPKSYRDAAFMGIMRKTLLNQLKELFPNIEVCSTYGYITKYHRERLGIEKSHINDGYVIAKNFSAERLDESFLMKFVRRHNRQIHKMTIAKGGYRKRNQAAYTVHGYRLFDRVSYNGQEGFIWARRTSGGFKVRKLNGEVLSNSISYKKLKFLEISKNLLIERK